MNISEVLDNCKVNAKPSKKQPAVQIIAVKYTDGEYGVVVKKIDKYKVPVHWETLEERKYMEKRVALAWYSKIVEKWKKGNQQ